VSLEATQWAFEMFKKHPDLHVTRRMLLVVLANAHNRTTGQCNPSLNLLVEMTGCHRGTIPGAIRSLEEAGLVAVDRRHGASSHYTLIGLQTGAEIRTGTENRTSTENRHEPVRKTVPDPGIEPGKDIAIPPNPPAPSIGDLFARFWAEYPLKRSRGQAERAFAKLKPTEQLLSEILDGLRRAKTLDSRFLGGYIPHGATWLNAKGWQDEHDQEIPKPATSAAYGQRPGTANSRGQSHEKHQPTDNSAVGKVNAAIAARDAREPFGGGFSPDDFIELGSSEYHAIAH